MAPKHMHAKVRPMENHKGLEKASLLGAACVYVAKDSFLTLTSSLASRPCVVEWLGAADAEKLPQPPPQKPPPQSQSQQQSQPQQQQPPPPPARREAMLCAHTKGVSANVVLMTRAFLDASGFRVGDQVRIVLAAAAAPPDARRVVVEDTTPPDATDDALAAEASRAPAWDPSWEFSLAVAMRPSRPPAPSAPAC